MEKKQNIEDDIAMERTSHSKSQIQRSITGDKRYYLIFAQYYCTYS